MASNVGSRAFQNARLQKQFRKEAPAVMEGAVAAYRAGKIADAATLCRRIIEMLPDHFDALRLLGVIELDCGRFNEAEQALNRAVGCQSAVGGSLFQSGAGACQAGTI